MCRVIIIIGFIIFSLVVTYIFNQRIGVFKTRTIQVAYGGLKSHEPAASIELPKQIDTAVSNKVSTAAPSKHMHEMHGIEIIEERSDASVCFDKISSGKNMCPRREVEVHEEL